MRIGEINQDNYQMFTPILRSMGVKNTDALDKLMKQDKPSVAQQDQSFEARTARLVAAGYGIEGMFIREGDESWKKIVPVSDEARQAMINTRREAILENVDGTMSAESGDREGAISKSYILTLPPRERLSASWTLGQIAQAEGARITDYIKSQIPGWQPGDALDKSILTETNFGLGTGRVDVRV